MSGETATGTQQTTFDAMDQFINVMTDPFIAGRGDRASAAGAQPAMPTRRERWPTQRSARPQSRRARCLCRDRRKAPPMREPFERRWSVWGAGYGGTQSTDGNAAAGSQQHASRVYGGAAGFDYRLTPDTLVGFSLGGGGTNFISQRSRRRTSEMFQAGHSCRHNIGAAYIAGALAYGWQDVTTDRNVTSPDDQLRAHFDANACPDGSKAAIALSRATGGLTPYAAGQFTTFWLPDYAEQVVAGANTFALAYGEKDVTASRSELGLRGDTSFAMQKHRDAARPRGVGAQLQHRPQRRRLLPDAARRRPSSSTARHRRPTPRWSRPPPK